MWDGAVHSRESIARDVVRQCAARTQAHWQQVRKPTNGIGQQDVSECIVCFILQTSSLQTLKARMSWEVLSMHSSLAVGGRRETQRGSTHEFLRTYDPRMMGWRMWRGPAVSKTRTG